MCGIVGYIGRRRAQPILFHCLDRLEYRGYDSCGIAVLGKGIKVYKDRARVAELARLAPQIEGMTGIGHTRWATHGEPSQINAHPHCDCTGKIAVVHNGIISNYQSLRKQLISEGHRFTSETDTEVIPHLIEKYYTGDLEKALAAALRDLHGSYAIIALVESESKLAVARKESPLIIGIGDKENFIASDVPAVLDYTRRVMYLDDGDIATITGDSVKVIRDGKEIAGEEHEVLWNAAQAQKGGYEHFMLKEIHEQPQVIRDTLVEFTRADEPIADLSRMRDGGTESMLISACGTSYHAGLVGKYLIEELVGIPVRTELASELNYYSQILARTMAVVITQSGETADALKAIKRLKAVGCKVLAITNVVGSSASRTADHTIYTRAGPEISVAATKSFIAQLMVLYWLAIEYSGADGRKLSNMITELRGLPSKVKAILDNAGRIQECAKFLSGFEDAYYIGRGINYPIALEGALKLKEISYIHAEGYAAGELKHGPFALLSKDMAVVAIVTEDKTGETMLTNIKEIRARGAPVIALAEKDDEALRELVDMVIPVPRINTLFSPVLNVVALQLLAYYTAKERGCPIDFPRNLAKSVTVE